MSAQAPAPAHLFRQHIVRTSRFLLRRLESEVAEPGRKPDPRTYLNVLGYAAKTDEAWPHASRILLLLGPQMEQAGHRHDWIEQLRTGIGLSQQHGDAATEAELRMQLGHLHQLMGDYEDAKRQLDKSLLTFAGLDDKENCARVWYRMAATLRSQRQYDEAIRLAKKALESFAPGGIDAAHGHFRLGVIYTELGRSERAVEQFSLTIDNCRQANGEIRLLAWSHANIGRVKMRAGHFDEAKGCFAVALEYFDQIDDPVNEAVVIMNLGVLHFRAEAYEEALEHFQQAKRAFHRTHELPRLAKAYTNLGICLRKLERWDEAEEAYQMSLDINRRLSDKKGLANALSGLAAVAQGRGRHEEALVGFDQALAILEGIQDQFDVTALLESTRDLRRTSAQALDEAA